jgi:plasmid replication initiation protein
MAEVQKINPNRLVIKQGDKLSFAQYTLSLTEAKFLAFVMAQIDMNDTEFKEYSIKVSDIAELTNAEQNETRLKKFAKTFQGKVITLDSPNGDFTTFNWWHHITYVKGEARFLVQLHDYMKPLLLTFSSHFGKSSLLYISQMEKLYTPRFYYMLCSYQAQYKNELELEVIELMNILQVKKSFRNPKTGYGLFKQKILTPAVEEINKITNLNLTFLESQKIGKKVTHIRFEFTKKVKDLLDFA